MYCPDCGHDAGDANFCPECGADLKGVKGALRGETAGEAPAVRTTGQRRKGGGGKQPARAAAAPAAAAKPAGRLSPAVIWAAFGLVAVIVVLVVVLASHDLGGSSGGNASASGSTGTSATPVSADTSGSYQQLVDRADALYNEGAKQMPDGIPTAQSSQYFAAASAVYKAAWAKQAGDPNVGTDWATALFYGGNVDAALTQVNVVLKKSPSFQKGLFNKGIFLSHKSRFVTGAQAKQYLQQAKAAFSAAVAADPGSDVAKQADSALQTLKSQ